MPQIETLVVPEELAACRDRAVRAVLDDAWKVSQDISLNEDQLEASFTLRNLHAKAVGQAAYAAVHSELAPDGIFDPGRLKQPATTIAIHGTATIVRYLSQGRDDIYDYYWQHATGFLSGHLRPPSRDLLDISNRADRLGDWWVHVFSKAGRQNYDAHILAQISKLAATLDTQDALQAETEYFAQRFRANPSRGAKLAAFLLDTP